MLLRLALIGLIIPLYTAAQTKPGETLAFETFVVTGKRPSAAETEGPEGIRTYDESEIENSGSFTLQEFLETLPRGNGEEQLVLVDGVPMELSGLTPAMIASIEVSYSGSMPQYGAYARGRIINIRTKPDYDGREFGLRATASLQADGWRREFTFSGGSIRGPWRMNYSAEYNRNDAVTADARDFSREQDHRARGGRDFRLPWGDPAVVQAVSGNLNGVVDASGNPVPVALVPENAGGALAPGNFMPGVGPSASGQRFFNTSPYLYLASPAETLGARFSVNRTFKKLRLSFSASHRLNSSERDGPPPVTAASAATLVPAAFTPFGQDVMVGLVHTGFGPVVQQSEGNNTQLNFVASWMGSMRPDQPGWRVMTNFSLVRSRSESDTRDLDPAAFTAALASANPATRFNPFVGAANAANLALYPSLAIHRIQENANHNTRFYGSVMGPLGKGWGAGPVFFTLNANANSRQDERTSRNVRGVVDGTTRNYTAGYGLTPYLNVPLLKERPRFYRLDWQLNGSYSATSRGGDTRRGGTGLFWMPARGTSLSARVSQNLSTPGVSGDEDPDATVETLMDPRRTPAVSENVQIISRRSTSTETSRGDDMSLNMTYEPSFRPGLKFNAGFLQRRSSRATGSTFRPQDVIDNEALFTSRIVREAPTAADIALGQPGRILVVDTTASAVAKEQQRTLNAGVEFVWPAPPVNLPGGRGGGGRGAGGGAGGVAVGRGVGAGSLPGQVRPRPVNRFTFNLDAEYPMESRYEVAEGQAFVSRENGPSNRPKWTTQGNFRWNNRRWTVNMNVRHNARSQLGTIPPITSTGFDVSYRFETAFWGKFGKNLRVRFQAQNVGRDEPPWADVVQGYRGGSAVGTTVGFSVNSPW